MGKLPRNAFEYIPFEKVYITDPFWSKRIDATCENTLPAILKQLKITGRWDVFRLVWKPGDPNPPHIFWDRYISFVNQKLLMEVIRQSFLRPLVIRLQNEMILSYVRMLKNRLSGYGRVSGTTDMSIHILPSSSHKIDLQIYGLSKVLECC